MEEELVEIVLGCLRTAASKDKPDAKEVVRYVELASSLVGNMSTKLSVLSHLESIAAQIAQASQGGGPLLPEDALAEIRKTV